MSAPERTRRWLTALGPVAAGAVAGIAAGLLVHSPAPASHPAGPPAPRSCTFDGGGTLVSGDAGTTNEGTTWVCTDGTLVQVSGYGNGLCPTEDSCSVSYSGGAWRITPLTPPGR